MSLKNESTKREFRWGLLIMIVSFLWGILIFWGISAVLYKMWVWHVSWNLIPVFALLVALFFDVGSNNEIISAPTKKYWDELDNNHIITIEDKPVIAKQYTGIY